MMFNTVLVLMAALCVANAAFTVNVFGDGSQLSQSSSSVYGCNNRACEQLCRRLGFVGGICVGDRCKCDNFKQPREEIEKPANEQSRDEVPELLLVWNDEQESNEIPAAEKDVNEIEPQLLDLVDNPAPSVRSRSARAICYALQCNSACIRAFYRGGVCVYNTCRCYR